MKCTRKPGLAGCISWGEAGAAKETTKRTFPAGKLPVCEVVAFFATEVGSGHAET